MKNFTISTQWFNEISTKVHYENAHTYNHPVFGEMVEADFEVEAFAKVSRELGWM